MKTNLGPEFNRLLVHSYVDRLGLKVQNDQNALNKIKEHHTLGDKPWCRDTSCISLRKQNPKVMISEGLLILRMLVGGIEQEWNPGYFKN